MRVSKLKMIEVKDMSGVFETTPTANFPLPLKTWHQNATHMGKFQSTYRESFKYNKK